MIGQSLTNWWMTWMHSTYSIVGRVMTVEDTRWIAYELHDGLMQWIHGAHLQLDSLAEPEGVMAPIQSARRSIEMAAEEGRALIQFLEGLTDKQGSNVIACLEEFVGQSQAIARQAGQELRLNMDREAWPPIEPSRAWNIQRIVQQAVQNAIQHAGPCSIQVHLGWTEDRELLVEVLDRGRGFVLGETRPTNHFGLASMKHRARMVQGELELRTALGEGCLIRLRCPVS